MLDDASAMRLIKDFSGWLIVENFFVRSREEELKTKENVSRNTFARLQQKPFLVTFAKLQEQ